MMNTTWCAATFDNRSHCVVDCDNTLRNRSDNGRSVNATCFAISSLNFSADRLELQNTMACFLLGDGVKAQAYCRVHTRKKGVGYLIISNYLTQQLCTLYRWWWLHVQATRPRHA